MNQPNDVSLIQLNVADLALATGLILVAGIVSLTLRLRLERKLAVASLRTVVQLLLVGYVIRWVFHIDRVHVILAVVAIMVLAATRAATQRPSRTFRGVWWRAGLTLALSGLLTTIVVTSIVIGVRPWYQPQYLIPLLGMTLGNALTATSLCLDTLLDTLSEQRAEVEMELAQTK